MGAINCFFTVIMCILVACEIFFINDGHKWYGTNVRTEGSMFVKLVL